MSPPSTTPWQIGQEDGPSAALPENDKEPPASPAVQWTEGLQDTVCPLSQAASPHAAGVAHT